MAKSIFEYKNYVTYLQKVIELKGKSEKGVKLKFAKAMGCQPSYLSQVLNGKVNFNLEQAMKLNRLLKHDQEESKYLIWLIEKSRAGTTELKKFCQLQINEIRDKNLALKEKLKSSDRIDPKQQSRFYRSWVYPAIYVSLSIPSVNETSDISKKLNLPIEQVEGVVQFLKQSGLVIEKKGKLQTTKKSLHLDKESELSPAHHLSWRGRALQAVEFNSKESLHYSNAIAIHSKDFKKLKEHFINSISDSKAIIAPSPEEQVYALTLDLFKL